MRRHVRPSFLIAAALAVTAVTALAQAACGGGGRATPRKAPPQWLVYLESDFRLPRPTFGAAGQRVNDIDRCGEEKFQRIWTLTDGLIEEASAAGASLALLANMDATTVALGQTFAFNTTNAELKEIANSAEPSRTKTERSDEAIARLVKAAKTQRQRHAEIIKAAPQHTQNLFQAVETMRGAVPEMLRGDRSVVVVFVTDMVHYNTAERNQRNVTGGQLNMLQEEDRAALLAEQKARTGWWINGRTLTPLRGEGNGELEVRAVLVDRCTIGEALPGAEAPNWALIRGDVHDFWRDVMKALGAELRWDYKPKTPEINAPR